MNMFVFFFFFFFFDCLSAKASLMSEACWKQAHGGANISIGVVIDESSRVGKEQKIAMELAVQDFSHCLNLVLHVRDSKGNSARAASAVMKQKEVDAIVGNLAVEEASFISQLKSSFSPNSIIISLSPSSSSSPPKSPYFMHMSTSITYQAQCIASIVAHFKWPKVILIHQQAGLQLHDHSSIFTHLSHSLHAVDSSIHRHLALPRLDSLSNPDDFIQGELEKLRRSDVNIFVVMQCSLELSVILFEKARVLGMMEKGFVWIVSDDQIGDLLDSVDASVTVNMQGVIGLKKDYADSTESFREFKSKFRRKYASEYPSEENSTPSIYSLLSYDAIRSIVEALNNSEQKTNPIDHTDFEGLSGKISFNNGFLSQKPVFRVVNVIGRSYREVALWSPKMSFTGELSPIIWPGGKTVVPKGWSIGSSENPLRIGVPANGAFNQFVKVTTNYDDQGQNLTQISGFSIEVFEAAVKQLPYDLYYKLAPYYGSYDEMVAEVHNKSLDAAVGDTEIMADRYVYAEFSQPYIESGLVMVVTVKHSLKESKFIALNPFTKRMWLQLLALSMLTGAIVWFSEYATGNEQFMTNNSFLEIIGSVLWLSVTIVSFSQREHIKNSASKVVLTAWICVVFVVAASFTAVLSSMMTVPRLQPSVEEIDYLRNTNAVVGCNGNSFIVRYLINVLRFKQENVKMFNSINEYPQAFKSGEIKAAFFVAPHAKVFLAEYCNGYVISGPSFKLGGFGFVFQRGSPLALDISEAILKVTQSGEVNTLEQNMLHLCNCTSSSKQEANDIRLGPGPFSGLFQILGVVLGFVLFINIVRLLRIKWTSVYDLLQQVVMKKRNYIWAVLTEWYSRFGSTFFKQEIVEMNEVDAQMEPNLVEIQMAVQSHDSTPRL